jgi:hypothetical protein
MRFGLLSQNQKYGILSIDPQDYGTGPGAVPATVQVPVNNDLLG